MSSLIKCPLDGAAAVRELTGRTSEETARRKIGVLHWRSFALTIGCGAQGPSEGATTVIERVTCTACLSAYTHNDYPAAALPTVADVEPIAADMTATPPSIREPADADDRGPARAWGSWQAPPRRRRNIGREARIATGSGHKLHLKIDLDDSGAPCAIKAEVHKEGSVFRGMLDTICALASQGLQHGASIHEVASRLIGVRFEPDGAVEGHATVRECLSIVDLLGRMIEAEFPRAPREDVLADEAARRARGAK
jgi:hypothetical protein